MELLFDADLGGMRIHSDARADALPSNSTRAPHDRPGRALPPRRIRPGSAAGRELLAQELTHVVQHKGDGTWRKMTVSDHGDPQEIEADQMAHGVAEDEHRECAVARQPEATPEEEYKKASK